MADITAGMVKELREATGLGMMECKKALEESGGDMKAAGDLLRIKSGAKASKAAERIAAEGVVSAWIASDAKLGALLEVNCETDFVAKNEDFRAFAAKLAQCIAEENPADVAALADLSLDGSTVEASVRRSCRRLGRTSACVGSSASRPMPRRLRFVPARYPHRRACAVRGRRRTTGEGHGDAHRSQ